MNDAAKNSTQSMDKLLQLSGRIAELERDLSKALTEKDDMRERQAQFQRLVENIGDVIFEVDHLGVILYFSPIGKDIWGYDQEDVIGKNFIEFVHPDDRDILIKRFVELSTGVEYPLIYRIKNKSGEFRWVRTKTKTRIENGTFIGAIGTLIDVSDQKRMEETLREREDLFRNLVDYMHDAMIIISWDGSILFSNRAAARIIEYERAEELVGHNMVEYIHPDSLQKAAEDLEAVKADKMGFLSEYQLRSVTGRHIWVESVGGKIIFRGDPANLVCIRDITSRKRAEGKLLESEEKYRNILENIEDGYFEVDLAGNFTFFNPSLCRILGYPREEMPGMNNRVFMDAENAKKVFLAFNEIYVTGVPTKGFEWETIRKDGARTYIEVSVSLIVKPGEKPTGFRGIARDITERKQAEQKLQDTLESLRKSVSATVQVMVSAVEIRDPYTAGHQNRAADLARAIATELGLPQSRIDGIRMAGSIHDIGKLSVPAEILSNPTELTELEFSMIKEHAHKGYKMLKDVVSPWPLAEIVYQHHERMDGSGYPRHLKGEEIFIEARILAVADVVESMASHRPYRPALGLDAALHEIENNKGTIYDADAVDACLRLFREKGYQLVLR